MHVISHSPKASLLIAAAALMIPVSAYALQETSQADQAAPEGNAQNRCVAVCKCGRIRV